MASLSTRTSRLTPRIAVLAQTKEINLNADAVCLRVSMLWSLVHQFVHIIPLYQLDVLATQLMEPQFRSVLAPKILFRLSLTITATALLLSMVLSGHQLATAAQWQSLLHAPIPLMLTLKIVIVWISLFPPKTQLQHLGTIIALVSEGTTRQLECFKSLTRMLVALTPLQELINAASLLLSLLQSYQFFLAKVQIKNNPVAAQTWLQIQLPEIALA